TLLAVTSAAALVVAACGSSSKSGSTTTTTAATTTAAAPTASTNAASPTSAAASPTTGAASPTTGAGVTSTSAATGPAAGTAIKIRVMGQLQATGFAFPEIQDAAKIEISELNATGGINGRPVDAEYCNDKGDANDAGACARQAVSNNDA